MSTKSKDEINKYHPHIKTRGDFLRAQALNNDWSHELAKISLKTYVLKLKEEDHAFASAMIDLHCKIEEANTRK